MKCIICSEPATKRFSPDLDIQGIGACDSHLEDVRLSYILLISGGIKEFEKFIKNLKKAAGNEKKSQKSDKL